MFHGFGHCIVHITLDVKLDFKLNSKLVAQSIFQTRRRGQQYTTLVNMVVPHLPLCSEKREMGRLIVPTAQARANTGIIRSRRRWHSDTGEKRTGRRRRATAVHREAVRIFCEQLSEDCRRSFGRDRSRGYNWRHGLAASTLSLPPPIAPSLPSYHPSFTLRRRKVPGRPLGCKER